MSEKDLINELDERTEDLSDSELDRLEKLIVSKMVKLKEDKSKQSKQSGASEETKKSEKFEGANEGADNDLERVEEARSMDYRYYEIFSYPPVQVEIEAKWDGDTYAGYLYSYIDGFDRGDPSAVIAPTTSHSPEEDDSVVLSVQRLVSQVAEDMQHSFDSYIGRLHRQFLRRLGDWGAYTKLEKKKIYIFPYDVSGDSIRLWFGYFKGFVGEDLLFHPVEIDLDFIRGRAPIHDISYDGILSSAISSHKFVVPIEDWKVYTASLQSA